MNTTAISVAKPFTTTSAAHHHRHLHLHLHLRPLTLVPIKCNSSSDINTTTSSDGENTSSPPVPPSIPPPKAVEIRFRRGSRRKKRLKEQQDGVGMPKKAEAPKDWDSMTLTEKAVELYVGEKGLLFWLNKLAYASIFVIIGAWILFRFVGPALNLYQLDSAPLPPTSIFKGS